ncbi:MAG: metal ABC transporter solute-binding protein, Zn/Mn family [Actinomycetota bacterium]
MRFFWAIVILVGACSADGDQDPATPLVIATTGILGDVVTQVGGNAVVVQVLIPSGVDPHDYLPSAQQVAAISQADLVLVSGLGLEEGLADLLEQSASEGLNMVEIGPEVNPLSRPGGGTDPHFWQDPWRMKTASNLIADELANVGVDVSSSAGRYVEELEATIDEIESLLAGIPPPERLLVTNHDSFRYFAERFGFEIVGVVIPGGSTEAGASSAELAALVETITDLGVKAIFTENVGDSRLARVLADEVGPEVGLVALVSDALGPPGSETGTYLGMMLHNARAIAGALA